MERAEQILAIAHDLKSPLLAIERLSEILLEDPEALSDDARRKVELIHESAVEASECLAGLDASALAPEEPEEATSERVDVAEMAQDVVDSFQTHAECKDQTLHCATSHTQGTDDCIVLGDPLQLREAMNNLVGNAVKFSPHGGTVEVWVERLDDAVCVSVTDNGPGLSSEDQDAMFEPFQRAGPDPTGDEDSTGVGLYIVDQIVDQHDGRIEVESSEGEGSTFTLLFPPAPTPPSASGPLPREAQCRSGRPAAQLS